MRKICVYIAYVAFFWTIMESNRDKLREKIKQNLHDQHNAQVMLNYTYKTPCYKFCYGVFHDTNLDAYNVSISIDNTYILSGSYNLKLASLVKESIKTRFYSDNADNLAKYNYMQSYHISQPDDIYATWIFNLATIDACFDKIKELCDKTKYLTTNGCLFEKAEDMYNIRTALFVQ